MARGRSLPMIVLDDLLKNEKVLEATEMWLYRQILSIPSTEHACNEEVLRKKGLQWTIYLQSERDAMTRNDERTLSI